MPKLKGERFQTTIKELAELYLKRYRGEALSDFEISTLATYWSDLRMNEVVQFADGVARTLSALLRPRIINEYKPYRDYIEAIFGQRKSLNESIFIYHYFLEGVDKTDSIEDIKQYIVEHATLDTEWIGPLLPEEAKIEIVETINTLLKELGPLAEEVIKLRLGLGGNEKLTLKEIGLMKGLSTERIRQIEMRAFRKLRHPDRSKGIRELFSIHLVPRFLTEAMNQRKKNEEDALKKKIAENPQRKIEELTLSPRVYNLLKDAGISTFRELLYKPQEELITILGKKGMELLVKQLEGIGLRFPGE